MDDEAPSEPFEPMRDCEGLRQLFPGRARGAFEIEGKWYMLAWSYDPSPPSISDAIIKVTLKCHGTHELKGTPEMDGSIIMDGSIGPQKLHMWGTPGIFIEGDLPDPLPAKTSVVGAANWVVQD